MDDQDQTITSATVAFFSGTGGTEAVAQAFEAELVRRGVAVRVVDIASRDARSEESLGDLLVVLSPVYGGRLASIVERWVRDLPAAQGTRAAVISVSGGGEVTSNRACREHSKRLLQRRGYRIVYERMLVMPSNFATDAGHRANLQLIRVMPRPVARSVSAILDGEMRLTAPPLPDQVVAWMGAAEHLGARLFGLTLRATEACINCGLCARECPTGTIRMQDGRPRFGFDCIWCMRCIYRCPQRAISSRMMNWVVLKDGYDLRTLVREAAAADDDPSEASAGKLWHGVVDYLAEEG